MCKPFSCIITKNQTVYSHPNPLIHSHTEIMKHYNLKESDKDPIFNSFVKIETYPKYNKSLLTTPIDKWDIIIDETSIPSWYENDKESFETIIRKAAISWLNRLKEIDCNKQQLHECYRFVIEVLKEPFQPCEKAIATSAGYSYNYAKEILKGRFPLGEKAIATSAVYSFYYSRDILEGPFALGEKAIATDAYYSYLYAKDVLKGPFPLGEKAIATNAYYSYMYAKDVLKGPFPLGEKIIATNAYYSYIYAKDVLKGPFELGEKAIFKDLYSTTYLKFIKPKLTKQDVQKVNNYLKKNKKRIITSKVNDVIDLQNYLSPAVIAKLLCN